MKKYIFFFAITLCLPCISNAENTASLLFEGGMKSLIATKDTFFIEYSDQVTDGCLPQPARLKDKMEVVLRQNGFSIEEKESVFNDTITITALGFGTNSSSCAIHLKADLQFISTVLVPYSAKVPNGPETFAPITYPLGSVILTGSKHNIQARIETQVKDFAEKLYLDISRSRDDMNKKFPQILEHHAELKAQRNQ